MNAVQISDTAAMALFTLMETSVPIMMVALIVGLVISLIQALTQIQEMTLSFVPKMVAVYLSLLLLMPFMVRSISDLHAELMDKVVNIE
jgi:flagellar biosynthetic protein FliQ